MKHATQTIGTIARISAFRHALAELAPVIGGRASLPILSHVRLAPDGVISATNLEHWLTLHASQTFTLEQPITLPWKLLTELLALLPETETVTLLNNEQSVTLQWSENQYRLMTLPESEFPVAPEIPTPCVLHWGQNTLARLVRRVQHAVSKEEARPALRCVHLALTENHIECAATDTSRLAYIVSEPPTVAEWPETLPVGWNLPAPIANRLAYLNSTASLTLELGLYESRLRYRATDPFQTEGVALLIEQTFPNYERVRNQTLETTPPRLVVPTAPLSTALERLLRLMRSDTPRIIITYTPENPNRLLLQAHADLGDGEEQLSVEPVDEPVPIQFALNANYLLQAIRSLGSNTLKLHYSEPLRPVRIAPEPETDTEEIIMPMVIP